uniref:Carboxylesterase type B domain-containing protein n=1 Tax=Globodera rostochiensis TaxID=31243 RepID=A0A914HUM0_GLORO
MAQLIEKRAVWLQNYSQLLPNLPSSDPIRQNPWQSDKYFHTQQKENSIIKNGNWTSQHGKRREFVRVRIGGGPIKGAVSYYAGPDKPVFMFKGIPMAEPPVGTLRFRPLQKKRPWGKVLDATKYSPACPSNTTRTHSPQHYISEDCIYMNVFTDPKCMREKPCPVLFYVHGGGFVYDSATMFNDSQIVRKYASDGVVFLIPAYRLGVFGFLDLGDDRTVKRNLGMHDIIFALEWAQQEVHAFGGDPERVTVMGNSAGGSAVAYLCTSPALTESHFQQAIISSGSPYFTNDTNRSPSKALVEQFNCSGSNNRTADDGRRSFWSVTDWETAECLRHVDSLELLRQQQINEEKSHLFFVGPETDSDLLPSRSYAALLKYWKARPLLMMTTANELHRLEGDTLHDQCIQDIVTFGFLDTVAYDACIDRYNATFMQEKNMRISYESMHASAFLTALVNTRKGGQSFVGEFEIANYSSHANDMYFFVGLHEVPMDRLDVKLMDWYYPQMIKNFLDGKAPDKGWKPQNWNGRNYFRLTFNVSDNCTLTDWPHGVDGYQDVAGLDFWLRELAEIERNGTQKAGDDGQTWQSVFVPKGPEGEEEGAEDGKREEYLLKRTLIRPTKSIPAHGAFMARPLPEMLMPIAENNDGTLTAGEEDNGTLTAGEEDNGTLTAGEEDNGTLTAGEEDNGTLTAGEEDNGTLTAGEEDNGTLTAGEEDNGTLIESEKDNGTLIESEKDNGTLIEGEKDNGTLIEDEENNGTNRAETTNKNEELALASGELHKVWTAFWLTTTVTVLLAISFLLFFATKMINRHRNCRCAYSSNNSAGDSELYTEKSRIFVANDANAMRYA